MKENVSRKGVTALVSIFLLLAMMPAAAFAWGDATHAYISGELKARSVFKEMWGSLGPDIFNFIFDPALCPTWLADQTHGRDDDPDSFMKVWDAASRTTEKALAYGFVSHNEVWGADYTAHIRRLTPGMAIGYINEKALMLLETPVDPAQPFPTFEQVFTDIGLNPDQQLAVAHVIAEYAIDIVLSNDVDPMLGLKLQVSAHSKRKNFPALLVEAYAENYAEVCPGIDYPTAVSIITGAEAEYRRNMIAYGRILSKPEPMAVELVAGQIVSLAQAFLGEDVTIPEGAEEIVVSGIYNSMVICSDYLTEITETIDFVRDNLNAHDVTY